LRDATVVLSKQNLAYGSGNFERLYVCDTHARTSIWEAQQAGLKYAVFDIQTGNKRLDFEQTATTYTEPE
jgi:hypothetical protein